MWKSGLHFLIRTGDLSISSSNSDRIGGLTNRAFAYCRTIVIRNLTIRRLVAFALFSLPVHFPAVE